jgi:3-methyladenine DNA glycosylase AlkD
MDLRQTMTALAAAGTERNRTVAARRGAGANQFGVLFKELRALARRIGRDQALARGLWATGNTDARLLACMAAEPAWMTEAELDAWVSDITYYVLVDEFVSSVASRKPGVRVRMERWTFSARDWVAQAGWDLAAVLALRDPDLGDRFFLDLLTKIEREIGPAGNRTRHAMNGALIAIGLRNEELQWAAVAAAARIGPVVVDHGQTGCVTPAAIPYIEKATAHRRAHVDRRAGGGVAVATR